jgi:hypothetical protein
LNLKTTGPCKFFLYLQDPVITEPCIFIALGSGATGTAGMFVPGLPFHPSFKVIR